ncbi:hypothetical protein ACIO3O_09975 [Streptomyces sp. NPDC087440]|uniref:hypothetical protein n=1 Tax=Streptomyces sp. NPDC087440 TaxID=3365790 RepID=UPI00382A07EC
MSPDTVRLRKADIAAGLTPAYTIPVVPPSAWTVNSRRSVRIGRVLLLCVLAVQAGLSSRMGGRAFPGEARTLVHGHLQLDAFGSVPLADPASGLPSLYPVLAALTDSAFGLTGVRVLSLLAMLGTTAFVYALSARLFRARAALGAAALFSVCESTVFSGFLADGAALGLCLLVLAGWLVARGGGERPGAVLLAVVPAVLSAAFAWGTVLFLPTLVVLAALTCLPGGPGKAVLRAVLFAVPTGLLLYAGALLLTAWAGPGQALRHASDTPAAVLWDIAQWGGLVFLCAVGGGAAYVRRARLAETSWARIAVPGRVRRVLLAVLLCASPLLAVGYVLVTPGEAVAFQNLGYGLALAAPLAGLGLSRLVGAHFRNPQLGILVYVAVLVLGLVRAHNAFVPPDSTRATEALAKIVTADGRYLADEPAVPAYYLRDRTREAQWERTGRTETPRDLAAGRYDAVVLSGRPDSAEDTALTRSLRANPHYRLLTEDAYVSAAGPSSYRIWIKK